MTARSSGAMLIAVAVGTVLRPGWAAAQDADPSWRVGRLGALSGSVSSHGPDQTGWVAAILNAPVQVGDAIWAGAGATADLQVQQDGLVLDGGTELDVAVLDGQTLEVVEPQGRLFLDLYDVSAGQTVAVTTPRGVIRLLVPGRYEIAAGDNADPTRIAVVAGSATISSGSFSLTVTAAQMAEITGDAALNGHVDPLVPDPFLTAQLRRLRPPAPGTPAAVCAMTGGASLSGYGRWATQPQFGAVWFPQVAVDWAPYREGRWSYVAPWGWTWVDAEPWGFAPFHYGRWSQFDGRWGWIPVEPGGPPVAYEQPAYAPALVDFLAAGAVAGAVAGVAGGLLAAGAQPVGWVPLGPREPYRPSFAVGQPYLQRLSFNRVNVDNRHVTINNVTELNQYDNRRAFTSMPAAAMARSEPVPRSGPWHGEAAGAGGDGFRPLRSGAGLPPPTATVPGRPGTGSLPGNAFARPAEGPRIDQALFHPSSLPNDRTPFRGATLPPQGPPIGRPMAGPIGAVATPDGGRRGMAPPGTMPGHIAEPSRPGELPPLRQAGGTPVGIPAAAPHPGTDGHDFGPGRPGPEPAATGPMRPAGHPGEPVAPRSGPGMPPHADRDVRQQANGPVPVGVPRPAARPMPENHPHARMPAGDAYPEPRAEPHPEPHPEPRNDDRPGSGPRIARPEPPRAFGPLPQHDAGRPSMPHPPAPPHVPAPPHAPGRPDPHQEERQPPR